MADFTSGNNWSDFYAGILPAAPSYQPGMTGRGLPLSAVDRLPRGVAGIDPISWTPPVGPSWNQPTRMDLAAIDQWNAGMSPGASPEAALAMFPPAQPTPAVAAATGLANPVTNVTASMKPRSNGGLLDLIFGPSKNGMGGLAGLLGGPNQGGILGAIMSQQQRAAPTRATGDALIARATGATSSAENQAWRQRTYGGDGGAMGAS